MVVSAKGVPQNQKNRRKRDPSSILADEVPPSYPLPNTPTDPESKPVTNESTYDIFFAHASQSPKSSSDSTRAKVADSAFQEKIKI
jgi:hypothetical protein